MERGFDCTGISAVTLCHDGQGKYLLGQRSERCRDEQLRWDLLGSGQVEFGERLEEAIRREVKEETGADVRGITPLGFREVHRTLQGRVSHWIAFDFTVLVDRAQVYNAEPEKCDEIRWCKLDEFPEPMHSQWPKFYKQYETQL